MLARVKRNVKTTSRKEVPKEIQEIQEKITQMRAKKLNSYVERSQEKHGLQYMKETIKGLLQ